MKIFNRLFWLEVTAHNELEKLQRIIDLEHLGWEEVDMQGECVTAAIAKSRYRYIDFCWKHGNMHDRLEHLFVTVNTRIAS